MGFDSTYYLVERTPAGIYLLKVNNRNTRTRCEICSKLTINTSFTPCSSVSIVNFEQVNDGWDHILEVSVVSVPRTVSGF